MPPFCSCPLVCMELHTNHSTLCGDMYMLGYTPRPCWAALGYFVFVTSVRLKFWIAIWIPVAYLMVFYVLAFSFLHCFLDDLVSGELWELVS